MPLFGNLASVNLANNLTYAENRTLGLESATVGLFTTTLQNGVKIEITSGNHTGFMRYTFPRAEALSNNQSTPNLDSTMANNEQDAHVLVDLTHVLPAYSSMAYSQKYLRGSFTFDLRHTMVLQLTQVAGRSLTLTQSTFAGILVLLRTRY
jgi:hypothetical protein